MLLKRGKKKRKLPTPELNIISLMDVLTTMLFFILTIVSFTKFAVVPANGVNGASAKSDDKPMFALQVLVKNDHSALVWLGSISKLQKVNEGNLKSFLKSHFSGNDEEGFVSKIEAASTDELLKRIHEQVIEIKKSFPHELSAVAAFSDKISYPQMVNTLHVVREIDSTSPPVELVTLVGKHENTRVLFPNVIISEWAEPTQGS